MMKATHHEDWKAAFDMPHNREQALAVIAAWAQPGCMTFSADRCARVYECLTSSKPRELLPTVMLVGVQGWVYVDELGRHGFFGTQEDARTAGYSAVLEELLRRLDRHEVPELKGRGMNIIELLDNVGHTRLKFQYLHECVSRIVTSGRGRNAHTAISFGTTEANPGDFVSPGLPQRIGIIVWMDREDFERAVRGEA
jgi:hypothetical protein